MRGTTTYKMLPKNACTCENVNVSMMYIHEIIGHLRQLSKSGDQIRTMFNTGYYTIRTMSNTNATVQVRRAMLYIHFLNSEVILTKYVQIIVMTNMSCYFKVVISGRYSWSLRIYCNHSEGVALGIDLRILNSIPFRARGLL